MGSGAWNSHFPPHSAEEEPGWEWLCSVTASNEVVIYKKWRDAVECHLSSVAWTRSLLLCACGWPEMICARFHMCAREAPRSYKSTHVKGPEQLRVPSLILFCQVPCVFVSILSHMVSSATSTTFWWWLWVELPRIIPATIPLFFPQRGVWWFFVHSGSFGDFAKDNPVVGGLAGHWSWGPGAVGTVLLLAPHLLWWPQLCAFRPRIST